MSTKLCCLLHDHLPVNIMTQRHLSDAMQCNSLFTSLLTLLPSRSISTKLGCTLHAQPSASCKQHVMTGVPQVHFAHLAAVQVHEHEAGLHTT
jgi:hypothetical protein